MLTFVMPPAAAMEQLDRGDDRLDLADFGLKAGRLGCVIRVIENIKLLKEWVGNHCNKLKKPFVS